jgi:hypothetical protein
MTQQLAHRGTSTVTRQLTRSFLHLPSARSSSILSGHVDNNPSLIIHIHLLGPDRMVGLSSCVYLAALPIVFFWLSW